MPDGWSDEELRASVEVYLDMLEAQRAERPMVKKDAYRALAARFGRSDKSFEFRMQNISHVMQENGEAWVKGLLPRANVGTDISRRIAKAMNAARAERALQRGQERPAWLFAREKDGQALWPFGAGDNPDGLGWTEKDEEALQRFAGTPLPLLVKERTIPQGQHKPQATQTTATTYQRDPEVVAWVLHHARGICECCRSPAPFVGRDGQAFLEVHHVLQLAQGGSDTVFNAVAVCPNCHRRLHFGSDADHCREGLYAAVPRLRREAPQ